MIRLSALAALITLAACTGPQSMPALSGMKDGRPLWTLSGLSDNNQDQMRRDVDRYTTASCATKPEIVNVSAVPSGITSAFLRWNVIYICDTAKVP
ncbi:hypothetical protein [Azospirillum canadense]|uniref:hypothetical protein n=1 Tax=Azospirillum canadense TaxID=403962 RepID=UPI00222612CE|nr:hypothetical protein [Azospirillum canadense]MCW2242279.1 hypothetical protein [Azospirillum canadense]